MSSNIIISSYTLFDFCREEYKMFIGFVIVIIRNLHFLLLSKSNYVIIGSSVFNWTLRLCISVSTLLNGKQANFFSHGSDLC